MNTQTSARSADIKPRASLRAVRARAARQEGQRRRVRVWDAPTRLFHWLLVVAITVAILTGREGGDWMALHGQAGLAIVGLVTFRLVWGLVGSTHARFASFLPTPGRIKAYLNGRWSSHGHNPLGALSVLALLGLLVAQAGTGLVSNDEIAFTGPLASTIDEALSIRLTGLHHTLGDVLLWLIGLHVLAILVYLTVKRNNLIKPMVTGYREAGHGEDARGGGPVAFVAALIAALLAVYAASGAFKSAPAPAPAPAAAPQADSAWGQAPAPAAAPQPAAPAW